MRAVRGTVACKGAIRRRARVLRVEANNDENKVRVSTRAASRKSRAAARMMEETTDFMTGQTYSRETMMNFESQNSLFFFRTFALVRTSPVTQCWPPPPSFRESCTV